jgi:peptidyl-prolyl cis-trans isomerase C
VLRIQARHIQLPSQELAQQVIQKWQDGESFEDLARSYSRCPTGRYGGNLGEFGLGHMPQEKDEVFLKGEIGTVYGPVATSNGHHLIEVIARSE